LSLLSDRTRFTASGWIFLRYEKWLGKLYFITSQILKRYKGKTNDYVYDMKMILFPNVLKLSKMIKMYIGFFTDWSKNTERVRSSNWSRWKHTRWIKVTISRNKSTRCWLKQYSMKSNITLFKCQSRSKLLTSVTNQRNVLNWLKRCNNYV